jgi:NTE family protein
VACALRIRSRAQYCVWRESVNDDIESVGRSVGVQNRFEASVECRYSRLTDQLTNNMAIPSRKPARKHSHTVVVFQGGGALGAYQSGVFEALDGQGVVPDWLVGTSIGAINAALIAGNPPGRRLERLKAFWERVAVKGAIGLASGVFSLLPTALRSWQALVSGIPGFFVPRVPPTWDLARTMPLAELSFYDTSPLRQTLLELIDFDLLNAADTRLTLCAVNVNSGELTRFDNRHGGKPIMPEHIMASGALPPGFAPVLIDGEPYWDGGVYSNTPLDIVLDDAERRDTLCFMVDLWDASEAAPTSLSEALTRVKDIQYASRTREHIDDHERLQNLRRAVRLLGHKLGPKATEDPQVKRLLALGCDHSIDIVHLVMKAMPSEDSLRDIDFSSDTLRARWSAGLRDGQRALAHRSWLTPPPDHLGMRVHTLPQEN